MDIKLDVKDRRILEIFTDNAKIPLGQLSKLVGVSREVAAYRINRLKQHGIVWKIVAKVDMTRFYQNAYAMFLRFSKLDESYLKSAITSLSQNPYMMWASALSGDYDIGTSFLTQTPNDLAVCMQSIEHQFGKNVNYDLFPYEKEYKNTFKGIFLTKSTQISEALIKDFSQLKIEMHLDEKDKILLYALSKNAELTNSELARLVDLSEEAVRLRIKNYEKTGVIRGYRALIDIYKLGLQIYYIFLRVENLTGPQEKTFETYVQLNPQFYYCAKIIGRYNVQASLWSKNPTHFQSFLHDLRNKFDITDFKSQLMFGESHHTYFPPAAISDIDIKKVDDFLAFKK